MQRSRIDGGPLRLGILGGGQLGRMLALAAAPLGIRCIALDPGGAASPAGQVCPGSLAGSFTDPAAIRELASLVDVLTVEIEHVDADALAAAGAAAGVPVHPAPATVRLIQDKLLQKEAMRARGVPVGWFERADTEAELRAQVEVRDFGGGEGGGLVGGAGSASMGDFPPQGTSHSVHTHTHTGALQKMGYPVMVKSRLGAYDGRGNFTVRAPEDVPRAWAALGAGAKGGLFVEAWVPFARELAVLVVRSSDGTCAAYPAVHTIQRDSICHIVLAPAGPPQQHAADAATAAAATAPAAAAHTPRGAPSPTACALAAIGALQGAGVFACELFELAGGGGYLLNEIAPRVHNSGHFSIEASHCSQFEAHVRAVCGLPVCAASVGALRCGAAGMINILGSGEPEGQLPALVAAALAQPQCSLHWYGKSGGCKVGRKVGHVTVTGRSAGEVAGIMARLQAAGAAGAEAAMPALQQQQQQPLVGIVMGSDSDLPTMGAAAEVLRDFGVPFELTLISAHRTPARLEAYGRGARARGLRCIIAGAGGAAHLPGMLASLTPLPVVGVPVPLKHLDGVDSLYSILQMPKGVPVATVAIGNAANAALLAVRMLGMEDGALGDAMAAYQARMEAEVLGKAARLEAVGWEAYLAAKK
jgi:phosphoribosylaminoimidazole carboxylase